MLRRVLIWIVRGLIVVVVLEAASALAIRLLNPVLDEHIRPVRAIFEEQTSVIRQLLDTNVTQLHEIHPVLGWRYAPNYHEGPHRINAAGLRSDREYAKTTPTAVVRIAAFGDSFVYGTEVSNEQAWPALLEHEGSGLEVLNYGVPGYGSDQAYLRYELEGADYSPQLVLLAFPPTDLARVVNVYRRFYSSDEVPLFKPRYELDGTGELSLVESPVRDRRGYESLVEQPESVVPFGVHDQWFEPMIYRNPLHDRSATVRLASATIVRVARRLDRNRLMRGGVFNTESAAFRIQVKIFEIFVALARTRGSIPVVVMLPDRRVLQAMQNSGPRSYDPLIDHLKEKRIDVLDASDAFVAADLSGGLDRWFAPYGHYSAQGNRVVSAWLARALRDRLSLQSVRNVAAVTQ